MSLPNQLASTGSGPLKISWRTRLRTINTDFSRRLRAAGYLRKWLILGIVVGTIAGLGAVAFYDILGLAGQLLLKDFAGYQVATPAGEGNLAGSATFSHPWLVPVVTGLGGLISGVLVFAFAPEAEGHGTDAAISAVHENPRGVRLRAVLVKIVASAVTIGSGGSGGREGPTAQISAGFGSFLTRMLDLNPADGRILVAIGIGSGIGSIFGAPLGGALLSAEILYRDDIEVEAIIPGIVAAIVGYTIFSAFQGFEPLFGFAAQSYEFTQPISLLWYAVIGIAGGIIGLGYAKSFYGVAGVFRRLPGRPMFKPALGGVLVGTLGLVLPGVLGTGYGWIQKGLGPQLLSLPLWVVLALPLAKILATSLSIGSGGSGGIFGPGMVIGAFTGASVWRLLAPIAPGVPHSPAPFVIVGMMACFGGISRAPLAIMVMTAEMTGGFSVLAPAMVAVGLATLIVRRADDTIYRSQLENREASPAHRLKASMPLLDSIAIDETMDKPRLVVEGRELTEDVLARLVQGRIPGAPVVDETGAFIGTVRTRLLQRDADTLPKGSNVAYMIDPAAPTVFTNDHLDVALEALMHARANWVTVLDDHRHVAGIVAMSTIVKGYRTALRANLRQISLVDQGAVVIDGSVGEGAPAAGQRVREIGLPRGTIIMTIQRDSDSLLPAADTVLIAGDRLGILTNSADASMVSQLLGG